MFTVAQQYLQTQHYFQRKYLNRKASLAQLPELRCYGFETAEVAYT